MQQSNPRQSPLKALVPEHFTTLLTVSPLQHYMFRLWHQFNSQHCLRQALAPVKYTTLCVRDLAPVHFTTLSIVSLSPSSFHNILCSQTLIKSTTQHSLSIIRLFVTFTKIYIIMLWCQSISQHL